MWQAPVVGISRPPAQPDRAQHSGSVALPGAALSVPVQALQQQWEALQLDRGLLMQQLSAEKDGHETDKVKIKEAE